MVIPAPDAEKTLLKTYAEVMGQELADQIILVDNGSRNRTVVPFCMFCPTVE